MAEASGRRVVVTGGAGFLGSHLCESLLERGDEVVAIDNLVTGRLTNIEHLFGAEGFTYTRHDVSSYMWVPERSGGSSHRWCREQREWAAGRRHRRRRLPRLAPLRLAPGQG